MSRKLRGATVAAFSTAAFLFSGLACVKDDAVIEGRRDGGADARAPLATVVPAADDPDDDAPDCRHCAETLDTNTARGTLCRKNGNPSSVRILNALVECVCYDKCIQECASYCAGAKTDDICGGCIPANCGAQAGACFGDVREAQ